MNTKWRCKDPDPSHWVYLSRRQHASSHDGGGQGGLIPSSTVPPACDQEGRAVVALEGTEHMADKPDDPFELFRAEGVSFEVRPPTTLTVSACSVAVAGLHRALSSRKMVEIWAQGLAVA